MRDKKSRPDLTASAETGPGQTDPGQIDPGQIGTGMSHIEIAEPDAPNPGQAGLDTELQAHIGRQLRSVYDSVVNQPVPDRFHELLEALDKKTGAEKDDE
jgi:Anti-sigma factor NepR